MKIYTMIIAVATLCFVTGYQFAIFNSKTVPGQSQTLELSKSSALEKHDTLHTQIEKEIAIKEYSHEVIMGTLYETKSDISLANELNIDNIDTILSNIENFQAQETKRNVIGNQFDLFKQFLINNPEHIDYTVEKLDSFSIDDPRFHLLLSAIQSIPNQVTDKALFALASEYGMSSDPESQLKFVTLLANTSSNIETDEIIQGLVDLAVIDNIDMNTRLEALNLLKPFQVQGAEKELIIKELKTVIYNANGSEAEMLLPHLMRFSANEQRAEIVTNILTYTYSDSLRLAVLENISAGSIPISNKVKTILMEIAKNEYDPLNISAKNTLVERFDLSYAEYAILSTN